MPQVSSHRFISEPVVTICAEQSSHRPKSGRSHASRKDARKQERTDLKKRKADHFIHSTHSAKRRTEEEHVKSPRRKRMKMSEESVSRPPASQPHNVVTTKVLPCHRPEELHTTTESVPKQKLKTTALERLVNKSTVKPRKLASTGPRNREEEEEDAYIAYLESKLGYAGGGSRRKDDDMDGLGGMLHCICYLEVYLTVLLQICLTLQKI
jgi:nucleolar MIF4G domain-containing protein 1